MRMGLIDDTKMGIIDGVRVTAREDFVQKMGNLEQRVVDGQTG